MSLDRFHEAQASRSAGYDTALAEIRRGRKTSHWIWYIFPQLAGLGRSAMAEKYAIRDLAEACDYLRDPLLRARDEEITAAVSDQLARGLALEDLDGQPPRRPQARLQPHPLPCCSLKAKYRRQGVCTRRRKGASLSFSKSPLKQITAYGQTEVQLSR